VLNAAIRTARSFTGRLADVEVVGDGLAPLVARGYAHGNAVPENVRFIGLKCSHDGRFVPSVRTSLRIGNVRRPTAGGVSFSSSEAMTCRHACDGAGRSCGARTLDSLDVFRECRCRLHLRNSDSSPQHRSVIVFHSVPARKQGNFPRRGVRVPSMKSRGRAPKSFNPAVSQSESAPLLSDLAAKLFLNHRPQRRQVFLQSFPDSARRHIFVAGRGHFSPRNARPACL
jgi:hypothetical protein